MFKSIKEERLERLKIRKFFNQKYNIELIKFLKEEVKHKDEIVKTINFINKVNFVHPSLNSSEYKTHPLRVAKIVYQINKDVDFNILNVALLHNIFEISEVTEEELLKKYNDDVLGSLKRLKINRLLENNIQYKEEYYYGISKDRLAAIIKTIDKFDNLFLLCLNNNDKIRTLYLDEVERFVYPLVEEYIPSLFGYYKELVKNCHQIGFLDKERSIKLYNEDYS